MVLSLPPSIFLPPLPRPSPSDVYGPTLSPIPGPKLQSCIDTLKVLMLPTLGGIDGSVGKGNVQSYHDSKGSDKEAIGEDGEEEDEVVIDEFEKSWAENWLNQVIRRGEAWLAELETEDYESEEEHSGPSCSARDDNNTDLTAVEAELVCRHQVLESATSLLALIAGCSASGSLTRQLAFPLSPLIFSRPCSCASPNSVHSNQSIDKAHLPIYLQRTKTSSEALPQYELDITIHDAALADHLSVGVQTWGSSILLGRIMAKDPAYFGLLLDDVQGKQDGVELSEGPADEEREPRILELGAGTGLLSIIARAVLDLQIRQQPDSTSSITPLKESRKGLIVATDYHPLVLENLQKCIDLNFSSYIDQEAAPQSDMSVPETAKGIESKTPVEVMKLDWSEFPKLWENAGMQVEDATDNTGIESGDRHSGLWSLPTSSSSPESPPSTLHPSLSRPFSIILAADCIYDLTHASLIRTTVSLLLALPVINEKTGEIIKEGGVLHLLSPIRKTYGRETESIARCFPIEQVLLPRKPRAVRESQSIQGRVKAPNPMKTVLERAIDSLGVDNKSKPKSTAHRPVEIDLDSLRSSLNSSPFPSSSTPSSSTPASTVPSTSTGLVLSPEELENLSTGVGIGKKDGWRLCTKRRRELERLKGSGRTDETEYWWWEIGWA